VAVDDDLGAVGEPDPFADLRLVEGNQLLDREVDRSRDVTLARVAPRSLRAVVLGWPTHVEHGHFTEAARKLVEIDVAHCLAFTSARPNYEKSLMCSRVVPVPSIRFRWHTWSVTLWSVVETVSVPVAPLRQGA
jgi:hypothetical protein